MIHYCLCCQWEKQAAVAVRIGAPTTAQISSRSTQTYVSIRRDEARTAYVCFCVRSYFFWIVFCCVFSRLCHRNQPPFASTHRHSTSAPQHSIVPKSTLESSRYVVRCRSAVHEWYFSKITTLTFLQSLSANTFLLWIYCWVSNKEFNK